MNKQRIQRTTVFLWKVIFFVCLILPLSASAEAPENDLFENAILLSGFHIDVSGSNVDATVEPDEPNEWGMEQTVWWSWVAPATGCVRLRSTRADFSTALKVYRGENLADLVEVSYWTYYFEGDSLQIQAELDAEAGTLYYIQAKKFFWKSADVIQFRLDLLETGPVIFQDPHLETIVRSSLRKSNGTLTRCDLLHLENLIIDDPAVTNLTGLEWATELTWLYLFDSGVQDLSPLFSLTNLSMIWAENSPFSNLTVFTNLPSLSGLGVSECGIQDISALGKMTNLARVWLINNPVTNYVSLAQATHLKSVTISFNENPLTNLSMFVSFQSLTNLGIIGSEVVDVSPLLEMPKLKKLTLYDNPVTNHFLIGGLTNLESLSFNGESVTNLDFLVSLTNLRELRLYPVGTSNLTVIGGLTNLETLGIFEIPLTNTTFLSHLSQIKSLELNENELHKISFVAQMPQLQSLDLSYNPITNFSGLDNTPTNLWNLYLNGCGIENLDFLPYTSQPLFLALDGNRISDLSSLTNLNYLWSFSACDNLITNIAPLVDLPNNLYMSGNRYVDLRKNLLDVRLGSPDREVINDLIEKDVDVKFTPQKLPPVFDSPPVRLSDGTVSIQMCLNPNQHFELQSSTNLVDWFSITNFLSDDSPVFLKDNDATNRPQTFYRMVAPK